MHAISCGFTVLRSGCSLCEKDSWCAVCGGGAVHQPVPPPSSVNHPAPPSSSIYHPAPPSSHRTFQSQTYLTYIKGLRLGNETMCDWSRELAPSHTLLFSDEGGAPAHISTPPWLEKMCNNSSENPRGVDSLCALRDFMLQEALNVVKFA